MFEDRDDALSFRDELVPLFDADETDGFHLSLTLEGAEVRLGMGVARVRGRLDSRGYRVYDRTTPEIKNEGWDAMLEVRPS